jgi:hypothetical protein
MSEKTSPTGNFLGCGCLGWACALVILMFLAGVVFPPMPGGIGKAPESACLQMTHSLGLAMYSYANDYKGKYPDGKSSTEVFQQLLDGGYVTDPNLFYIPMKGKVKPVPGTKLKPENVSFDVTEGADFSSSDSLPIVFLTGYRIIYSPGAAAVPILTPYPHYWGEFRSWAEWWRGEPRREPMPRAGIAVLYRSNAAKFEYFVVGPNGADVVPHFIPPDFQTNGKTYRQLTPDGTLP